MPQRQPLRSQGAGGSARVAEPPMRVFGRRVRTFESFRDSAFRWFFVSTLAQMYSAIGQMFVRTFLVYELTESYAAVGLVALVSGIVQFLLGPYGGVLADRFPKKTVTQVFQFVGLLNAFVIGTLAIMGILEFWHLLISSVSQGILVALMVPARQAMVSEIVPPERIMNGVALNTAAMNMMQFGAPLIGGVLLATAGAGVTFFSMAGCYAVAILTMLPIPAVSAQAGRGRGGVREAFRDIGDGFRYIARHRVLRMILLLAFFISMLGTPFQGLLPGFVQDAFDAGPALAALFMTFSAIGAFLAALIIASLRRSGRGKLLILMGVFLGGSILGMAISPWIWLSLPIMILMGIGQSGRMAMASALIQEQAEPAYRGRAMSVLMMQFAVMQGGVFVLGIVAELVGIRLAVFVVAIMLLGALALFGLFSPTLRRLQ
ncbi:MAG: MFS transporter [Chloroflexi bacterium]|nr:MFS transporter [Chloroflexota bacterium]MCY3695575.1 MFS transporter [Chloroflexota bacterium]